MKTRILIADDNDYIRGKIKEALKGGDYELIEASGAQEAIELCKSALPALVFMDIHMPGLGGLEAARLLKEDPLTREIPLIHLTLSEEESLREESLRVKADGFIRKPFFEQEILEKVTALINRRGRFTTSYTARFIRSMILFSNSRLSAGRMVNMGHQICRALEVDAEAEKDILQAARLLSCAVCDGDAKRVVRLYDEMGFARPVSALLNAAADATIESAIVWALFCHETRVCGNAGGKAAHFGRFEGVHDQIGELYANPAVSVESPADLEYAQGEFLRMVSDRPKEDQSLYGRLLNRLLTHELLYHEGALFFRENDTLIVRPKDHLARNLCFEKIGFSAAEIADRLYIKNEGKRQSFVLSLTAPKTAAAPVAAALKQAAAPAKTLSARAFLADSPLGADDLEDLRLLEKDMQEFLEEISYTHHPKEALLHLNALLGRYASILMIVNEFSNVAVSLMGFTTELATLGNLDEKLLKKLSVLLSALVNNLTGWREAIFVHRDAADIHFLDQSLLADCNQAIAVLKEHLSGAKCEEDLELF
ncbi:MAG: response regulator [Campylobacterales bacterium]